MGSDWPARLASLRCDVEKRPVSRGWCTAWCMAGLVRWGPQWTLAASGRYCCWPRAACCTPGWAVVCPVHEASWLGSQALCLLSWCSLAELPSRCVVDSYSFPNELLFTKPSQAKILTGGRDLHEAQVDVHLSVSHSCVWLHCWAQ